MIIKGHTQIELTNEKTGEKRIYKDDNMITNFMESLADSCGVLKLNNISHTWNECMQGLMLFSKPIDEDPNNIWPRIGNTMVGNGFAGGGDYLNPMVGNFNSLESDITSLDKRKYVWDFPTSKANGTISCACLTSQLGGKIGGGNISPATLDFQASGWPLKTEYFYASVLTEDLWCSVIDKTESCLYRAFANISLYDTKISNILEKEKQHTLFLPGSSLLVKKYRIPLTSWGCFDPVLSYNSKETDVTMQLDEYSIPIPENFATDFIPESQYNDSMRVWADFNTYGRHVIVTMQSSQKTAVLDFDLYNKTSKSYILPYLGLDFSTSLSHFTPSSSPHPLNHRYGYAYSFCTLTNLIYIANKKLHNFNLATNEDNIMTYYDYPEEHDLTGNVIPNDLCCLTLGKNEQQYQSNMLLTISGNYSYNDNAVSHIADLVKALDIQNNKIYDYNIGFLKSYWTDLDNGAINIYGSDNFFAPGRNFNSTGSDYNTTSAQPFLPVNYLATINNLETPVIKTNAETMKVIYTLTIDQEALNKS